MKHFDHKARYLALAVGMALAACGGSESGTPTASGEQPKDTASSATWPTGSATKAPDTPPIAAGAIRGDVLIQALLTPTNRRDENGRQVLSRLAPIDTSWSSPEDNRSEPLTSPWVVVSNQITADAAAGLGANVLEFNTRPGAMKGLENVAHLGDNTLQLGVSAPGVGPDGNALAALGGGPLQISQHVKMKNVPNQLRTFNHASLSGTVDTTLSAGQPFSIAQDAVIQANGTDLHRWQGTVDAQHYEARLWVEKLQAANQFSVCLNFGQHFGPSTTVCNAWEVPNGWTAGQPLKFLWQGYQDVYHNEHAGSIRRSKWDTQSGPGSIAENDLNKTGAHLGESGISGALMAALFDAWTPRAQGMRTLPASAGAATGALSPTAGTQQPQRLSLLLESRATRYQDGATTGAYSPATGSYLHAFQIGTYNGPDAARAPTPEFPQMTLALHMANDPGKGLTLPRWTGANIRGADQNGQQRWLVQSEQLSEGQSQKTIQPDDLILFGSAVQLWREPAEGGNNSQTHVLLSVEQSQANARSVDLCWSYASQAEALPLVKVCSLWNVPQNWQPGQPLQSTGYYVAHDFSSSTARYWNTFVGAN